MSEDCKYVIRPAVEADVEALAAMRLRLQAHLQVGTPVVSPFSEEHIATLPEFYRNALAQNRYAVVSAAEGIDVPVAMLIARIEDVPGIVPRLYGRVDDVWVDPEHRRRGLCKRMMRAAVEYFRERGIEKMVLNWAPGNIEARETWTRMGFVPFHISGVAPLETISNAVEDKRESASL
ncbi:MAG: GNAT family N-acetyltransferase [FCB group bacterium]|jgi:ribosomal protein S18 acetylase RimI-like enzyme|nr:GNAT family N-acetyltransferase [FCB group bacterium]